VRSLIAVPLITDERPVGVVEVGTNQRRRFGEADQLLLELIADRVVLTVQHVQLAGRLQEAQAARDHFLASAAHDLKSPISALSLYAELLEQDGAKSAGAQGRGQAATRGAWIAAIAQRMRAICDRMAQVVTELMEAAMSTRPPMLQLKPAPSDLVAIVEQVVAVHRGMAPRHHIRLDLGPKHLIGAWDAGLLERALTNLLENAVKYSPDGGDVMVSVDQETDERGDWAVVAVRDYGIGIPAADLPRIFEPFERETNVGARAGAGIELTSVRQTVEQHGGTVHAESPGGAGARFMIRLPFAGSIP
jgi:signal transduction histidine kinase